MCCVLYSLGKSFAITPLYLLTRYRGCLMLEKINDRSSLVIANRLSVSPRHTSDSKTARRTFKSETNGVKKGGSYVKKSV